MENLYPLIKFFEVDQRYYMYNAKTNLIININRSKYDILNKYIKDSNADLEQNENIKFLNDNHLLLAGPIHQRAKETNININNTYNYAKKYVIPKKICLEITDSCNLRCKYCFYTINEKQTENNKKHGNSFMTEEIALSSVKMYIKDYLSKLNKIKKNLQIEFIKKNPPAIGFYGGEPLLNFKIIKFIVEFLKKDKSIKFDNYILSITTNLTLLSDEMIDYFIYNNFFIHVSLDGPKDENDKNRVFKNGIGTFDSVFSNLLKIKTKSKSYYQKYVQIQAVAAFNLNQKKVDRFFENLTENNLYAGCGHFTKLDFSQKDCLIPNTIINNYNDNENWFREIIKSINSIDEFQELMSNNSRFCSEMLQLFDLITKLENSSKGTNYYNTMDSCYFGFSQKFVSSKGKFHICERTDFSLPIGDYKNGIYTNRLKEIYLEYFKLLNSKRCKNCWIFQVCKFCVASKLKKGKFYLPRECECDFEKKYYSDLFKKLIILKTNVKIMKFVENSLENKGDVTIKEYI